jgi:predicted metal-dependent phosphoesterase TrpH
MDRPPESPGGRRIDLHAHTHFSDGQLSPAELVARALARGLAALSITDHDSLEALEPARQAAASALELVPGIELSTAAEGYELHVLGYYLDPSHERLRERLDVFRHERLARVEAMVERLVALGAPIEASQVVRLAGPGVVGRPHVAAALVRAGHAESMDDAFKRYLGRQGNAYVPRPAFRPAEAIELIRDAGGVSVLAHPGAQLPDSMLERLKAAGLQGVEVWHPQHSAATRRRYRALAQRLDLIETGGSDFHGQDRGADLGEVPVPPGTLSRLKEAAGVTG